MKYSVVFLFVFIAVVAAQNKELKEKGEKCVKDDDCIQDLRNMRCANNYCGCKKGERQNEEFHPDGQSIAVCDKVVDSACNEDKECSKDLDFATCNVDERRCVCLKENGCTDGATAITIISFTTMVLISVGVLKYF